jgi:hypothetical protein
MTVAVKQVLVEAWNWCDVQDKSTEFMFQYMADSARIDYDDVVTFVCDTTPEQRKQLSE